MGPRRLLPKTPLRLETEKEGVKDKKLNFTKSASALGEAQRILGTPKINVEAFCLRPGRKDKQVGVGVGFRVSAPRGKSDL